MKKPKKLQLEIKPLGRSYDNAILADKTNCFQLDSRKNQVQNLLEKKAEQKEEKTRREHSGERRVLIASSFQSSPCVNRTRFRRIVAKNEEKEEKKK